MADLAFSTTLLGQFLEDMEAYAEVKYSINFPLSLNYEKSEVLILSLLHRI